MTKYEMDVIQSAIRLVKNPSNEKELMAAIEDLDSVVTTLLTNQKEDYQCHS